MSDDTIIPNDDDNDLGIVKDIMEQVGDEGETSNEQTTGEGTDDKSSRTTTDPASKTQPTSNKQGTGKGNDGKQGTKQAAGPQDLVDKDGAVIALGGRERRFYETAQRETRRADAVTKDKERLEGQLAAIEKAGSIGKQLGLTSDEVVTGAQIIAAYKGNPIGTLKYLLTQAQAQGHNIEEITGQAGGVSPDAIKQMIDTALKPILVEQQGRADTQAISVQAKKIYDEFHGKFPDAQPHENSLARLLQGDPSLSPEAAYYKLRSFYLERGLDWTKPLEQLQVDQQQQGVIPKTQQQALPNGNIHSENVTDTTEAADVGTSIDTIIRDAMKQAGYN